MKVVSLALIAATALVCVVCTVAQEQPRSLSKPDRTVGAAEVYYFKEKNKTRAQVRIYAIGQPGITNDMQDSLTMDVIFECDGAKVLRPKTVVVAFSSHSATGPKFQKEHNLRIYWEGLAGMEWAAFGTRILSSNRAPGIGTNEVLLSGAIEYQRFLRLTLAHQAKVDLGDTHFVLTREHIKALNDLTKTIEK